MTGAIFDPLLSQIRTKDVQNLVFNVKDYGATGDGTTDDTTAFNSTNTAATAAGGLIYVPHGMYILNATSINNISACMFGESMEGTVLKLVNSFSASQNLIRIVSVSDIWVKNFTIDGNKSSVSSGTQYGLYLSTTTNCGAENILTQNWVGVGTHLYNNNRAFITNCYSTSNGYHGFEFEQNTNGSFTGVHGYSNTLHGVLVSPGEVSGTGSKGNTFTNVQCDDNSQYGLAFNAANADVSAFLSEGDTFTNVSLTNNTQYGLSIYKQNKQTFSNLYIAGNGFFGIYLFESANNTFSNIFLHNNSQAGNGSYAEILLEGYTTSSSHPSSNNVFSSGQIIIDGSTKANYAVSEGNAGDGSNSYVNLNIPNAGTTGRYNVLATTSAIISDATGFAVGANAALPGNQMGLDAPFGTAALRLYNPNSGGNFQFVTPNGSSEFWAGGNEVADVTSGGVQINNGYGFKLASSPTNGYVLTSDSSGNGTWKAATGGSGTVTSVSVVTANGFSGTVANATTTPAITVAANTTGIVQSNGSSISAVTVGNGLSFSGGTLSAPKTPVLIASGNFTAAASLSITSIPSTYRALVLDLDAVQATAAVSPQVVTSTNNGVSYRTTGYQTQQISDFIQVTTYLSGPSVAAPATTRSWNAFVRLEGYGIEAAMSSSGMWNEDNAASPSSDQSFIPAGSTTLPINALQVKIASGTFATTGTYNLWGLP